MKLPPLNALRVFETAARKGSFVAAGEELGVTSAAVSLQVRTLEGWLGRELFFRRNNQIRLTDAGEDLYRNAAQSLSDIATFTQSIQQDGTRKSVTISAVSSVAERWLPRVLAKVDLPCPIRVKSADDPLDLERSGVDIHISYGTKNYPDFVHTKLFQDSVLPLAAPWINLEISNATPDLLIETDWGRSYTRAPKWDLWFAQKGIPAPKGPIGTYAGSSSLALAFAMQGKGICLGQKWLASEALENGTLKILDPMEMPLNSAYYAITPNHHAPTKRVQRIVQILQEATWT